MADVVDIREMNPLNLAFVGDSVFELLVRSYLVRHHRLQPGKMHREAIRFVSARGQFKLMEELASKLSEQELVVFHRGRNASKATVAKHATPEEYRTSTGFETLLGWLYLMGKTDRIDEIFDEVIKLAEQIQ